MLCLTPLAPSANIMAVLICSNCQRSVAAPDLRTCGSCKKHLCAFCCRTYSSGTLCSGCDAFGPESQWYETSVGHQRLAFELAESERRGFSATTSISPDGRLSFWFPLQLNEESTAHLVVVTESNH